MLDLIPTDQNIFGLQDVAADEEAAALADKGEDAVAAKTWKPRSRPNSAAGPPAAKDAHDGRGLRRLRTSHALPAGRLLAPLTAAAT